MSCGIYKISSTIDERFYIGSSINLEGRRYDHFYDLKKGEHENEVLQRFYSKHGENSLKFEVLEECERDILIDRENFYISSADQELLFNMRLVVDYRCVHTEERKKVMSDNKKAYFLTEESKVTRDKLSNKTRERYENMTREERTEATKHVHTPEVRERANKTHRETIKNRTPEQILKAKEHALEMVKAKALKRKERKEREENKNKENESE